MTALAVTSDDSTAFSVSKDGSIFKTDIETQHPLAHAHVGAGFRPDAVVGAGGGVAVNLTDCRPPQVIRVERIDTTGEKPLYLRFRLQEGASTDSGYEYVFEAVEDGPMPSMGLLLEALGVPTEKCPDLVEQIKAAQE